MTEDKTQLNTYRPSRRTWGALGKEITSVNRSLEVTWTSKFIVAPGSTLPPNSLKHPNANS